MKSLLPKNGDLTGQPLRAVGAPAARTEEKRDFIPSVSLQETSGKQARLNVN